MNIILKMAMAVLMIAGLSSCSSEIVVEDGIFEFSASATRVDTVDYLVIDMLRGRISESYSMKYCIDDDKSLQLTSAGASAPSPYTFTMGGTRTMRLRLPDLAAGDHLIDMEFSSSKSNQQPQYLTLMFAVKGTPVTAIRPAAETVDLLVGGTSSVYVDVIPSSAADKTLVVSSSDEGIAECHISESTRGTARQMLTITGRAKGYAIITIYSADGSVSAGIGVTVK